MSTYSDVIPHFDRLPAAVIEQASRFPSSILADVAGRRGAMHGRIAPLDPALSFAGSAFTVDVRPGDNLMIHAAMALAQPGDVLVIDGKADLTAALMGEIMVQQCLALGIKAIVVDGALRDTPAIRQLGFPAYAAGTNPNGPTKCVPGRINHPVSVGGVTVRPGDLLVGDGDGIMVVERERAAELLPLAQKKVDDETARIQAIRRREALRPAWLDAALAKAGVVMPGAPQA